MQKKEDLFRADEELHGQVARLFYPLDVHGVSPNSRAERGMLRQFADYAKAMLPLRHPGEDVFIWPESVPQEQRYTANDGRLSLPETVHDSG